MTGPNVRERILPRLIEDELKESFLDYSMSVIVQRALHDDAHRVIEERLLELVLDQARQYAFADVRSCHVRSISERCKMIKIKYLDSLRQLQRPPCRAARPGPIARMHLVPAPVDTRDQQSAAAHLFQAVSRSPRTLRRSPSSIRASSSDARTAAADRGLPAALTWRRRSPTGRHDAGNATNRPRSPRRHCRTPRRRRVC